MTWVAAAVGAASVTMGAVQYFSGRKKAKEAEENRPEYQIPEGITGNVNLAKQQALVGMPDAVRQRHMRDLQRGQAAAYGQADTRKAGLTGIAAINQQGLDSLGNITAQDAAMMQQNQQRVFGAQETLSQYQDQQWKLNEYDPNRRQAASGEAMMGAGIQNIAGGVNLAGIQDYSGAFNQTTPQANGLQGQVNPYGAQSPPTIAANQVVSQPTVGFNTPGINDQQLTGVGIQQQPYYTPNLVN